MDILHHGECSTAGCRCRGLCDTNRSISFSWKPIQYRGLAICSGIAADPPGSLKRALFNSTLNLGAAALVVIISLLPSLIEGVPENEIEVYIATACASLTIVVVGLFLTLKLCTWNTTKNACGESLILSGIACAWVVIACLVSFRGPFLETGNGYFASWFAVIMSVKAAGLEWRNRVKQDNADKDWSGGIYLEHRSGSCWQTRRDWVALERNCLIVISWLHCLHNFNLAYFNIEHKLNAHFIAAFIFRLTVPEVVKEKKMVNELRESQTA